MLDMDEEFYQEEYRRLTNQLDMEVKRRNRFQEKIDAWKQGDDPEDKADWREQRNDALARIQQIEAKQKEIRAEQKEIRAELKSERARLEKHYADILSRSISGDLNTEQRAAYSTECQKVRDRIEQLDAEIQELHRLAYAPAAGLNMLLILGLLLIDSLFIF